MRNSKHSGVLELFINQDLNVLLSADINVTRCLVHDDDLAFSENGSYDADELFLT